MTTVLVALPQPPCLRPYTVIRSGVRSQESDGEHPKSSLGSGRRKRRTQVPGLRPRPKPCRLVWQKSGVPGGRGCFGVQTKLVIKRVRHGGVTLHLLYMCFHVCDRGRPRLCVTLTLDGFPPIVRAGEWPFPPPDFLAKMFLTALRTCLPFALDGRGTLDESRRTTFAAARRLSMASQLDGITGRVQSSTTYVVNPHDFASSAVNPTQ